MKKWIAIVSLLCCLGAVGVASDELPIRLESPGPLHDPASIQRGAELFSKNCMVCHTMKYIEHDAVAEKAGITLDNMPLNNKEWWLDVVPPDLTLIGRVRGAKWLYTYMHSFYTDTATPTGANNLLVPNTVMANIFAGWQGAQKLNAKGRQLIKDIWHPQRSVPYYVVLESVSSGGMSHEQFEQNTKDLVAFFMYASDPMQAKREHIGVWVLCFLAILFIVAVFLKRAYWVDIHE